MRKKRVWLIVGSIIIVVGSALILWITFNEVATYQPKFTATFKVDSEELIGLTMKIPGAKQGEYLELSCAKMINSNKTGELTNINGNYYSAGKPIYKIKAQSGFIYWETTVIKLYGTVNLTAINDKTRLVADVITINPKLKTIKAEQHITIKNESLEATADEIDTDMNLDKIRSKGMTTVSFMQSTR